MTHSPSRRELLAACGGGIAGVAGGYAAASLLDRDTTAAGRPAPVPLAWSDTEWPYPDYDPSRSRNPPAASAPDGELGVLWRTDLGTAHAHAPPVVANGRVATASAGDRGTTIRSLAFDGGDSAWEHQFLGEETRDVPALLAPGDGVFYRVDDYEHGPLGAFAATTGEQAWGVRDPPRGGWTVGAGRLYYGDRVTGRLRAYDARSGDDLWSVNVDDERLVVRSLHRDHGVFASSLGTLYALDPTDGSVRWDTPVPKHVRSGPVVRDGTAFVTKWTDGMDLLALDAASGDEQWRYPLSPTEVSRDGGTYRRWYGLGAATGDTVVVVERHADPTPGALHAVDAASGDRLWRVDPPEGATAFSKPTVVTDAVFVCAGGDARTELLRLDLADGATTGTWSLPDHGGAPVVADGRVLVQTSDELLAFG
jgi:outer membrane protein assembly factor BamB